MKNAELILRKQFGKLPEQTYTAADLERIRYYHDTHQEKDPGIFTVDEITWNDLDMDAIFGVLNATQSSVGEDYLYHLLHCMDLTGDERFAALTDYFLRNQEERFKTQAKLHGLGKITTFSIARIIDLADDLIPEKKYKTYPVGHLSACLDRSDLYISRCRGAANAHLFVHERILVLQKEKRDRTLFYDIFLYQEDARCGKRDPEDQ